MDLETKSITQSNASTHQENFAQNYPLTKLSRTGRQTRRRAEESRPVGHMGRSGSRHRPVSENGVLLSFSCPAGFPKGRQCQSGHRTGRVRGTVDRSQKAEAPGSIPAGKPDRSTEGARPVGSSYVRLQS